MRQRSGDDGQPFNPCACFEVKKKGKKGKREKGGMDLLPENVVPSDAIPKEKTIQRLKGGMDTAFSYPEQNQQYYGDEMKNGRLTGGHCNTCASTRRCKCPGEQPVYEPYVPPPPPICPPMLESNVIKRGKPERGEYDEFEANLNGTGITIRVLKNSHTVTDVIDSQDEDSGCETSAEICGKV